MCLYIDAGEHELGNLGEPVNYKAALLDHESKKWLNAMNVEMQSIKDNEVWVLVELPPNGKTVDLGEAAYIRGIKIYRYRLRRLIGLCQSAYIKKILKQCMKNSKRGKCNKPISTESRGDLKRELRVSCYTDAGYLMDADDLKSQTGYVFILNGGVVDWKSTKQSIFATSSTEAESVVPIIEKSISMYCGNTGVIAIANESGITKGARHFRAKVHYLREVIEYGDIKGNYDYSLFPFNKLDNGQFISLAGNGLSEQDTMFRLEDGELKDATFLCDRPNPTFAVLYKVNEEDCLLKTILPLSWMKTYWSLLWPSFLEGESRVFYCSNTNVVSVPVTCSFSGAYAAESSSNYFLGDQSGALHYLCLEVVGKNVQPQGDVIYVGDLANSVALLNSQEDSLKKVAYDPSWWMSALCTIGDEFCIGAKNRGELFLVSKKYLSDDVDEQSCRKMHVIGGVHMGEVVNCIRSGSLVRAPPGSYVSNLETLVFATSSGRVGVIASLPKDRFDELAKLQSYISDLQGRRSDHWRLSSYASENHFIDGDVIESFLDLDVRSME
nr:DNA damage-binding protein 1a [Tanacetum cinerariifolium]